jgi:hypothetical protein
MPLAISICWAADIWVGRVLFLFFAKREQDVVFLSFFFFLED